MFILKLIFFILRSYPSGRGRLVNKYVAISENKELIYILDVLANDLIRAILPNKNETTSKVLEAFALFCQTVLDDSIV